MLFGKITLKFVLRNKIIYKLVKFCSPPKPLFTFECRANATRTAKSVRNNMLLTEYPILYYKYSMVWLAVTWL